MSELMTFDDVVKLFRTTPKRVREYMALPGFPECAPGSTPRHRLWLRIEMRAFKLQAKELWAAARKAERKAFLDRYDAAILKTAANRRHHGAKRRAAEIRRTPPWADAAAIEAVYLQARQMEDDTGQRYDVDHIIPLQGKLVSGLHVAANLQVLPRLENTRKGNRYEVEL